MSKKKDVIFTSPRGGKYKGEFKDGKNMVKGHTLNLREGSM